MAQRSIEILIGRLVTDEAFRGAFLMNALAAFQTFSEAGYELTPCEIAALMATPAGLWNKVAHEIDPRLQKANLAKDRV